MNQFSLEGKTILITGASSGIGRQCAVTCSNLGARVAIVARDRTRLAETLSLMKNPESHMVLPLDLTDYEAVAKTVEDAVGSMGRFSGIVNCAGISTTLPFKLCLAEKAKEMLEVNALGAYNITREITKMGRFSKEGGSVIFIASIMGINGESGKSLYSMSKGALIAASKSLAVELSPKKIRVNTISPGAILTPINQHQLHMTNPEKRKALEDKHLLGLGATEDIANACAFLLSDASKWVTGTNMIVDGGYSAR